MKSQFSQLHMQVQLWVGGTRPPRKMDAPTPLSMGLVIRARDSNCSYGLQPRGDGMVACGKLVA